MKKILLFLLILKISSSCNSSLEPNQFRLKINFEGENTMFLVISYLNLDHNYIKDTINVSKKGMIADGYVDGFAYISIAGSKAKDTYVDNPNRIQFFIEPGQHHISLKENKFKEATLMGSKTQLEYEKLKILEASISKEQGVLIKERNIHFGDYLLNKTDTILSRKIDSLNKIIYQNADLRDQITLKFIKDYPDSYVSAFELFGFLRVNNITLDNGMSLYKNLSPRVQESIFGEFIKEEITATKQAQIGKQATNFIALNAKGDSLALEHFKGKYVLLDFWAGWCKPCKALHPALKEIYKNYHPKGLEIVGVSFDKDTLNWKKAIQAEELDPWHHIYDGYKNIGKNNSVSQKYNVTPIPAYILIDDRGIIKGRYLGADKENNDNSKNIDDLKETLAMIFENI